MKVSLGSLQALGRALMLPIAVLPVAGLLLRLGQPDVLNIPFIAASGDAIFSNLGLLFAIGVAVGFARDNNGAAGLAGVVCFLVATFGAQALLVVPPSALEGVADNAIGLAATAYKQAALAKLSVPIGILSGVVGGQFYNRFANIKLPEYLAFFGGRRFVPIVSGVAGLALAGVVGLCYDPINNAVDSASRAIVGAGGFGLFVYGVLNRLLIVTGLHHILNNIAWFIIGDYHGVTGDLKRFFAGDPSAGAFMTGFFPVMMFGLPAACLAMYHAARPERRKAVGGMLGSMAATSFLTGVTEPIEFSFMFLAPALYLVHAVLTGLAMVLMHALDVRLGFGFSAGLFDYVISYNKGHNAWMLIPIGICFFALYYGLFRVAIQVFDLKTPGREPEAEQAAPAPIVGGTRGEGFVAALGGAGNLISIDACTTRLRLELADPTGADEKALRALGARGFVRPGARAFQVVLGPIADTVAGEIREALHAPQRAAEDIAPWLAALGGKENLREIETCSSRICVRVNEAGRVDAEALQRLGARGVVMAARDVLHVVIGPRAETLAGALRGG
ncbi:MAG TPA: N-acetylglucosamine-specific PTS transporter subunit IIBC [Caulobacterales bacterium]|nr:N-acetylglucosamine-specific PTS transporter subunit IIBC [Caulobacterales bacterium]